MLIARKKERKRVGKTYLIRETLAGSFVFQHTGYANTGTKGQLFAFAASLKSTVCRTSTARPTGSRRSSC